MRLPAVLAISILVAATACGSSDDPEGGPVTPTATRQAASLLTPTTGMRPVRIPEDEAPHDNMTEWWYYTGHMFDEDGNRYGFEFVVFQIRRGSFPALYASHFAVTDNPAGTFAYDQKSGFDGLVESDRGFHLRLDDWEMQGYDGTDELHASMDGYAVDLTLTTDRDPVLHNQGIGYMEIGLAGASYYYSRPGMDLNGTLTVDGETHDVTGSAWMDHQWGDFVLVEGGGWDWFAVELDDGTALMVFELRRIEGVDDVPDFGTFVTPDGDAVHLAETDFSIDVSATWTSETTGATYPSGWTIAIPRQDLQLQLEPTMADQELDTQASTGTIYWEGEIIVAGEHGGRDIAGLGYVELTGYADPDSPDP